jgi:hypothetical protein
MGLPVMQNHLYTDSAANTTWPGIDWHQHNSQYPNAGYPTRALFYQPRAGFAYDLSGNGKTVSPRRVGHVCLARLGGGLGR